MKHLLSRSITASILASAGVLSLPIRALAVIENRAIGTLGTDTGRNATEGRTFLNYLILLWRAVITVGSILVLLFFIWGAIEWITAGGDAAKVQKARDRITQSMIGLIILVSSFVIIGFISSVFFGPDFNLLILTIPTPD